MPPNVAPSPSCVVGLPRYKHHAMNPALLNWERISPDDPWQNSLGMNFVSVPGTLGLFCIRLTRMRDYSAYAGTRPNIDQR